MSATEALDQLTKMVKDENKDCEWLVIKIPKKSERELFWVNYCDGDAEDEYKWLEGPHLKITSR
jgi:hypothetical protein